MKKPERTTAFDDHQRMTEEMETVVPKAKRSGAAPWSTQQRAVLTIVLGSYLMLLLDTSIIITGLPRIRDEFGLSPVTLSWVSTAYLVTFGGFLLLGARAGDIFGRKRVFLLGLAVFTSSSLVIGLAPSASVLIGGRAVQGLGAAILAPSTLAFLQLNFSEGRERTRALSAYAATAGIGSSLGLVLGGVLAGLLTWRIGFLINVPAGVLLFGQARRLLTETEHREGSLDIPGAVASTLGSGALVFGIAHGGEAGWQLPETYVAIALGFGVLTLFLWLQSRVKQPILPLKLFASPVRSGAYAARLIFVSSMMGFFFLTTQTMQDEMGLSAVVAGLGFLPMTVMTFIASLLVPHLTQRLGNGGVVALSFALLAISLGWLALADPQQGYLIAIGLPLLVLGIGNGLGLGPLTVAGVQGVAMNDAGAAAGLVNTVHQFGGSLGVAASAAIASAAGIPAGLGAGAGASLIGFLLALIFIAPRPKINFL